MDYLLEHESARYSADLSKMAINSLTFFCISWIIFAVLGGNEGKMWKCLRVISRSDRVSTVLGVCSENIAPMNINIAYILSKHIYYDKHMSFRFCHKLHITVKLKEREFRSLRWMI